MSARYAFDMYPSDDPFGNATSTGEAARLVRLEVDGSAVGGEYRHVGFGLGSGEVRIHADNPDAAHLHRRAVVVFVRIDTDPEQGIGAFVLEDGDFRALSRAEAGAPHP